MFDPEYIPETIDLVIADDTFDTCLNLMAKYYNDFGKTLGIGIMPRYMAEKDVAKCTNEGLSRDSLIYIHTNIEDFKGLYEAKRLIDITPARIILSYDPVIFFDEFRSDAIRVLGKGVSELPSTPLVQVSFISELRECFHIQDIRGELCDYLKQMGKMRNK